jgi:DNA-binding CsgD family transcriptional regulator/tetratricopeptide (TPR) repeat protein
VFTSDEAGLLGARFNSAELLHQTDALDAAAQRLVEIAAVAGEANDKVTALSRLAEVECDAGRTEVALAALQQAREYSAIAGRAASPRSLAELGTAEARCAFFNRDASDLTNAVGRVERVAATAGNDPRIWAIAARARLHASLYWYAEREIDLALRACDASADALARAEDAPPLTRARMLTLRAVIDTLVPERIHHADAEYSEAYSLAVRHGMVGCAGDAAYNALFFAIYCDEAIASKQRDASAGWAAGVAASLADGAGDAMLAGAVAACQQRYDRSLTLFERARREYRQGRFDWTPAFTTLQARVLFKAQRYADAERTARRAAADWQRAGLRGEGGALRVRAEALEALGRARNATAILDDAIQALRPYAPVYHLLAVYRCADRLRPRRAYREQIQYLREAICRPASDVGAGGGAVLSGNLPQGRLTPREREIARMVADGRSNPAIARELGISPKTVANHVAAIFEQLGLRARWQLTRATLGE